MGVLHTKRALFWINFDMGTPVALTGVEWDPGSFFNREDSHVRIDITMKGALTLQSLVMVVCQCCQSLIAMTQG